MEAKDCKCYVCNKQAVAFYPCVDPDILSHPYCADHLEEAMVDMAKAVWKDDKGMQAVAICQAKQAVNKYRQENQISMIEPPCFDTFVHIKRKSG